ncbi:MAG: OmpA family protein [bacterium]|nr:OmpA family protein [bacterium]
MKKFSLVMSIALLLSLCLGGCSTFKKFTSDKEYEDNIKQAQMAAIKGENIPLEKPVKDTIFVEPSAKEKVIFSDILFDYDSYRLGKDTISTLEKVATWLKKHRNIRLMIEGHCDERGSRKYNLILGEQRALSVRRYLTGLGISPSRLYTITYGEDKPVDTGHDEKAWAKNRRSHLLISQ